MSWASNPAYWEQHKAQYPFHAITPVMKPRPPEAFTVGFGAFLAVPMGDEVFWGFESQEARDRFVTQYNAKVME